MPLSRRRVKHKPPTPRCRNCANSGRAVAVDGGVDSDNNEYTTTVKLACFIDGDGPTDAEFNDPCDCYRLKRRS